MEGRHGHAGMKEQLEIDQLAVLGNFAGYPVVLVSTRDNVLTIAQVHYFSFRPLTLGIGIHRKRHSYGLVESEGEFVVNIATVEQIEAVKECGALSGRDGDKFSRVGLTPVPGSKVKACLIEECPVNIECRVIERVDFPLRSWFIGEVVAAHRAEGFDSDGNLYCSRTDYRRIGEILTSRK
jgi:flavin reductase (DIM6/NTAB) family NADH-FMN oxidoreductase RutF